MSEASEQHEHNHAHTHPAPATALFRFESFADAPSAQAAFEAVYPPGSSIEPALQALVDMGAQCKALSPSKVVCRYIESDRVLAGWCWQVLLERNSDKTIGQLAIALAMVGM